MTFLLFCLIISVFRILSRGISQKKDMISIYFNLFIIRKRFILCGNRLHMCQNEADDRLRLHSVNRESCHFIRLPDLKMTMIP